MKKNALFALLAVVPLMVLSCAKEVTVEAPEMPQTQVDPWTPIELVEVPALAGNHSVSAGFSEEKTKTQLDMNGAGTYAGLLWKAGDTFKMMGSKSGGSYTTATYSTSESGAKVVFTTGVTIGSEFWVNGLHSISPASVFGGLYIIDGDNYMSVNIPSSQTAIAGGVDPSAVVSYAQSATPEDDLHFKNVVSLIKFRLSGDIVSQVKSISFKCVNNIAGQFYLSLASSDPAFAADFFGSSREVVLSGDFATGQDYYLALAPSIQDGFTMTFSNSDGTKVVKKSSNKTLTLSRSTITDFGTINIGNSFPAPELAPTPYIAASAGASKPVTICVIPDGFRESELDDFELQAQSGINALFNTEPYKTYKNYFNVWILKKASNESGANITDGNGNITTARDCYFQSKWGADSYGDMSANSSRIFAFVEDNCPDIINGTHTVNEVPVLLIINDTRYGGIAHSSSNGQTYCMVPMTSGTLNWGYPDNEATSVTATPPSNTKAVTTEERTEMGISSGTWRNTLVHEFGGHSFGRLSDEYWYNTYKDATASLSPHSWPVPFGLNISASSVATVTPWAGLLESGNVAKLTATGKAQYTRIGIFQGGDVSMFNRWRSEKISCMIDNRFYFSTWQRWLIANRIMTLAGESALSIDAFLAKDKPEDPLRDGGGSPIMLPEGLVNSIPPKPVPMLPPPVLHTDW